MTQPRYARLTRIAAPETTLVPMAQAKAHLRLDDESDDATVAALLQAAADYLDGKAGILGRALLPQEWDYTLDAFPSCGRPIRLPLPPLLSVTSVSYVDMDGASQTLSASVYTALTDRTFGEVALAYGQSWPVSTRWIDNAVTVRFRAGYSDGNSPEGAAVPPTVKQAVLLLLGHWYENRAATTESKAETLPLAVDALLAPQRVMVF